jgi:ATP-dependent phosphoenolpyruvate carboxykinase
VDRYIAGDVTIAQVSNDQGVLNDGWEFVKWTQNGRSIIPMSCVEDAADMHAIPVVKYMGILNRDEGIDAATPGIVRFATPNQAAGFFMLGETTKTSAAGKEVGKTRSPFTQPFFPLAHGLQARRFSELAATMPDVGLWMMNTGFVGGDAASVAQGTGGFKVKIRHSSAMLEALLTNKVAWKRDPDFGYDIVDTDHSDSAALVALVPAEILNPVKYYERTGQLGVYRTWVANMNSERRSFLESYDVDELIIAATVG